MSGLIERFRAMRPGRLVALVAAFVLVVGLGATGAALASGGGGGTRHLTAYFTRTIGLYQGNDVRVLGVLLSQYEFPGDDVPVIRVSALKALEGDAQWAEKITELMDAVDNSVPAIAGGPRRRGG